jgi:hypothetical protein
MTTTRLCIFGSGVQNGATVGIFTVYERAVGLSNNVRRLGRVFVEDWAKISSGEEYIEPKRVQAFIRDPTMYDDPAPPESPAPRAA